MKTKAEALERPEAGDIWIYGPQWQLERIEVTKVWNNGDVDYVMASREFQIHRSGWWSMMQGAEVIRTAEEGE